MTVDLTFAQRLELACHLLEAELINVDMFFRLLETGGL
jgi:hypothetical protein